MPEASGNCSSSTPKISAAASWPTNFAVLFRPRLRPLYSLMKSSAKPSAPIDRVRKRTSRPDAEGPEPVWIIPIACDPKYPARMPAMMAMPPIVGVPRLRRWLFGPSSRISCPMPSAEKRRISTGVRKTDTMNAKAPL